MAINFDPDFLISTGQVHPGWRPALEKCHKELLQLQEFLSRENAQGTKVLPEPKNIFRALKTAPDDVEVVIVGQDPYPNPGHAVGLAFSVSPDTSPVPKSLNNIFTELMEDIGCPRPANGDLVSWTKQGVLLLNRVLTVSAGQAGSHRNRGWEKVTQELLLHLVHMRGKRIVAILWGKDAQQVASFFDASQLIITPHPSPLSAHRGFFGTRPFSQANEMLVHMGLPKIDWCLPEEIKLF